jgi:ribosomal protein L7/L12
VVTALLVVCLLGGLAWFGWSRLQSHRHKPEVPTGLRVDILDLQRTYRLRGEVPDPLPDPWRLKFQVPPFRRRSGESTVWPRAWVDLQIEGGSLTGIRLAVWRNAEGTAPQEIICEPAFAGPAEGPQLREFLRQLGGRPDKSAVEGETAGFRLFAWKHAGHQGPRRSVAVVAAKGAPEAERLLQKARTDWELGIATGQARPEGSRTSFDVVLVSFQKKHRARVLEVVCKLTGLGPAEGGTLIDSAPKVVKREAGRVEAEAWKQRLEAAGAKVEVK